MAQCLDMITRTGEFSVFDGIPATMEPTCHHRETVPDPVPAEANDSSPLVTRLDGRLSRRLDDVDWR